MTTVAQRCDFAQRLFDVEARLRTKAKTATSEFAQAGYAQAALEIARESLAHYRECGNCQSALAEELRVAA